MLDCTPSSSWPFTQYQPFFLVQPIQQVLADLPALAVQQNTDHAVPIAHSGLRDLPDAQTQLQPLFLPALVAMRRPCQFQNTACMPFARLGSSVPDTSPEDVVARAL